MALELGRVKAAAATETARKLRLAMLNHGVDLAPWPGGPASAAHDDADLERTLTAFAAAIADLRAEGELG
jgi:glutamate-1-semialdehyde aminotransferase